MSSSYVSIGWNCNHRIFINLSSQKHPTVDCQKHSKDTKLIMILYL